MHLQLQVWSLWLLQEGASVQWDPRSLWAQMGALAKAIVDSGATVMQATPTLWQTLIADGGVGEGDLMHQRGLAATGRARQHVEREFRNAAAEDVVESRHAGRKLVNPDLDRIAHGLFRQRGL